MLAIVLEGTAVIVESAVGGAAWEGAGREVTGSQRALRGCLWLGGVQGLLTQTRKACRGESPWVRVDSCVIHAILTPRLSLGMGGTHTSCAVVFWEPNAHQK